jgi:ribosomal-protein-alanine N-acetyltransferase
VPDPGFAVDSSKIPYVVERMTIADVPAVAALERRVFPLPWSAHVFEYELRHNPMAYFVVVRPRNPGTIQEQVTSLAIKARGKPEQEPSSQEMLGYGGFWFIVGEAHICTLAVHPDWRGRGLGELVLVHLIDRATEMDAAVLTLEVRASNVVAQNMYRKYGFVQTGVGKRYYTDSGEDAIIMTTDLISSAAFQGQFQALKVSLWQKLAVED